MHACAALLEEAFDLVRQEENALLEEDIDTVDELAQQRVELLKKVWRERAGYDEDALRVQFLNMQEAQKNLKEQADALHAKYRQQQQYSRKQTKYFDTDRKIHSELQKSFYCDKVS